MSAFVVIFERGESPGNPVFFERAMNRLSHRGPDGSNTLSLAHILMGHWHFYTTPEEIGEKQPLALEATPFKIVLDGRLDNRNDLIHELNLFPSDASLFSDAELILRAYARWGDDSFHRFVGEFAFVILNELSNELICVCDPLGERTMAYTFVGDRFIVASEPWAVLGACTAEPVISEKAVVYYFTWRAPNDGQTMFENVFDLLPAHYMVVSLTTCRTVCYWEPNPYKKTRYKTDMEYAEHFRSLLEDAIRSQLRSALPLGILMSGGLDSTSIASLAARMIAPQQLTTISYVFDEFSECDEREYIEPVTALWQMRSLHVVCDDARAYSNWAKWPFNPNLPSGNFYWWQLDRTYKYAQSQGVRVLLTGFFGDHLYSAGRDWIADLFVDGKINKALGELLFGARKLGWRKAFLDGHFRRIVRRILDTISPGAVRLPMRSDIPSWINNTFAHVLKNNPGRINPALQRFGALLDLYSSKGGAYAFSDISRFDLELRNPFRYRPLVEFIISIPAYQLYYRGISKYILRMAMQGILPESVRLRTAKTSFQPLYFSGREENKELISSLLEKQLAHWHKYVKVDWVLKNWRSTSPISSADALIVPFLCLAYDKWVSSVSKMS